VELYLHFYICLHGVLRDTFTFTFYMKKVLRRIFGIKRK